MNKLNDIELKETRGKIIPPLTTVLAVVAISFSTIAIYKLFTSSKGKIELAEHFGVSWN